MKLTIESVDQHDIEVLPLSEGLIYYFRKRGWSMIGQLRVAFPALERSPPKGIGYGKGVRRLLTVRFNHPPVCPKCQGLMLLYKSSRCCPEGCGGMIPMTSSSETHKAFPDLIVDNKKIKEELKKTEIMAGQLSMFDRDEFMIVDNNKYLD